MKKAEHSYAVGEYFDAAKYYKKCYSALPPKERRQRGEVAYRLAECYRRINFCQRARGAYINAIRYGYPDSTAIFYLAECMRKNGEYKLAATRYEDFLRLSPKDTLAINGLASCHAALQMKERPTRYKIKREANFFSRRAEYSPMYAAGDADILYFTSTRNESKGNDINGITGMKSADIFFSKHDENGKWQKPEPLSEAINSEFEDGACSFSPDGKTMYFTRCRTSNNSPVYAEIYSSVRSGAEWTAPTRCAIINDTLSSVAHPAVSTAGNYLYFVSDMPGGMGGLDLWRINIVNGTFGYVDNLGPDINTAGNEMFPSFSPDGTLYFSSDGHVGMGGLDIFSAIADSVTGRWNVSNMGVPLNSSADDFGMTFNPSRHNEGYFSSNRGDARGWDHIYSFVLPDMASSLNGHVYDKDGEPLPGATITLVGDDGTYEKIKVKRDGSYSRKLLPEHNYIMLATCRGYLNSKYELSADTIKTDHNYTADFMLASIVRPVLIDNIFYEFNRADLTPASSTSLDELVRLLNNNPNVTIELSAHCDYKGDSIYNERLSQRRAESVMRYLIKSGIKADRLTAKGYGESVPKVVTRSVQRQAPFLNIGDTLTESFIKTLTDEQQDICNAINRRTEFRVLRTTYGL
jgi:outer membrane protein OmpA-like peptidoglycan-associated protein